MKIIEYYIERSTESNWYEKYYSCSKENYGNTFNYINTNFRSLFAFLDIFPKFMKYNGIERSEWTTKERTGQELAKHWTTMMTQSKLFKKHGSIYNLTIKGDSFQSLQELEFNDNERWILLYLFLLNSYFDFKVNYIITQTDQILTALNKYDISREKILEDIRSLLLKNNCRIDKIMMHDIFWYITMYTDENFMELFKMSSESEKQLLYSYVKDSYKRRNIEDPIARKYFSTNYSIPSFLDSLKTIFVTLAVDTSLDFSSFFKTILEKYSLIFQDINIDYLLNFIEKNRHVFSIIYNEVVGGIDKDLQEDYKYESRITAEIFSKLEGKKIDDTSSENIKNIQIVSTVLKKIAKEKNSYRCEAESLFRCKYFTSKESRKNYLEIHHLIPREFSNEFEASIEILDNYVALCPHCHRLIHFATDRERYCILNFLYANRINRLQEKNLNPSVEDMKKYYNIEEE